MGAPEVAVAARHPFQQEARERLGATVPTGEYDVVIETAGSDTSVAAAVEQARHGGTVVAAGYFESMDWPKQAFYKEVGIRPSLGYSGPGGRREATDVADLLAARPELADTLITHRFPLSEAPRAFETAQDRSKGVFRVVVEP